MTELLILTLRMSFFAFMCRKRTRIVNKRSQTLSREGGLQVVFTLSLIDHSHFNVYLKRLIETHTACQALHHRGITGDVSDILLNFYKNRPHIYTHTHYYYMTKKKYFYASVSLFPT